MSEITLVVQIASVVVTSLDSVTNESVYAFFSIKKLVEIRIMA